MTNVTTHGLMPYIAVRNGAAAIDFYTRAFGAVEKYRLEDPADGRIGHAELALGGSTLMLSDEYPDFGAISPETLGGSPVKLHIYVDDMARGVAGRGVNARRYHRLPNIAAPAWLQCCQLAMEPTSLARRQAQRAPRVSA